MTEKQSPNGTLTPTEARAILETEAQEREKVCWLEIEAVLKKHNCLIDVAVVLKAGQVIPQIGVVSRPSRGRRFGRRFGGADGLDADGLGEAL